MTQEEKERFAENLANAIVDPIDRAIMKAAKIAMAIATIFLIIELLN